MRWISFRYFSDLLITTAVIFGLYILVYAFVWAVITPLQHAVLPDITPYASLLFLPHGIRVFATSLLGGRAIPGLVLGELAGNSIFWVYDGLIALLAVSLVGGAITFIVFEFLKAARVNAFYLHISAEPPPLHSFLLAGVLASAANGFLSVAIMEETLSVGNVTSVLAALMTGDVTGLLAMMMIARGVMPMVIRRLAGDD